jgi:short-subunit dehydrogenase
MKSLQNKIVWITGASSGIGAALAQEFAKRGAKLVLSARRVEALEQVKQSLNLSSDSVLVLPMDMLAFDSFQSKVAAILAHFGSIDVMVHNAGLSQRGLFQETTEADGQRLMDTNFTSVVALTRLVLPIMVAQQSGAFLITSSVSGKVGTAYRTMYAASKHALQGFFDGLRGELWRNNVTVTVACPGYIKTDLSLSAIGKDGQPYGLMDENQSKGIAAEVCASKMVNSLQSGKHEVVIAGFMETLGTVLKRFSPALLWQFTKNYNIKAVEK